MNLHRRHLNESQRAMVAARLANMLHEQKTDPPPIGGNIQPPDEATQKEAADMLNVT